VDSFKLDFPRTVSSVTTKAKRLETTKFRVANVLCFECLCVVDAVVVAPALEKKKSSKGIESTKKLLFL
jgi:hypothetical protein